MRTIQLLDLLRKAEKFHRELAAYYDAHRDTEQSDYIRRVVDYMGRHEHHLARCIHEYEEQIASETTIVLQHDEIPPQLQEDFDLTSNTPLQTVIEYALVYDDLLITAYERLQQTALSGELRQTLQEIATLEQTEERQALLDLKDET